MSRILLVVFATTTLVLSLFCCGSTSQKGQEESPEPNVPENAVYHWKMSLWPSKAEEGFLKDHNIKRMYVRLFDVVSDYRYGAVPEAETRLCRGQIEKGVEIVPTVFVTLEALKEMKGREGELAENIYNRIIAQMKRTNHDDVGEIQIDCDWTESTRESFFALCDSMCSKAHANGHKVSATIRLHQLSQPAPPVDAGVLMVYNVGELKDKNETNSILRADIVKKYLQAAPKYALPLDAAYPIFSWGVVFRGDSFNRLARIKGHPDSVQELKLLHDNIYEALEPKITAEDIFTERRHETVRYEFVTPETLLEVKGIVEKYLGGRPHRVILYHLDDNTIGRYTNQAISAIYE